MASKRKPQKSSRNMEFVPRTIVTGLTMRHYIQQHVSIIVYIPPCYRATNVPCLQTTHVLVATSTDFVEIIIQSFEAFHDDYGWVEVIGLPFAPNALLANEIILIEKYPASHIITVIPFGKQIPLLDQACRSLKSSSQHQIATVTPNLSTSTNNKEWVPRNVVNGLTMRNYVNRTITILVHIESTNASRTRLLARSTDGIELMIHSKKAIHSQSWVEVIGKPFTLNDIEAFEIILFAADAYWQDPDFSQFNQTITFLENTMHMLNLDNQILTAKMAFVPRKIVTGNSMRQNLKKNVSIIVNIQSSDGSCRNLKTLSTDEVQIMVTSNESVAVKGWVEVIGVPTSANAIDASEVIVFESNPDDEKFDTGAHNLMVHFLESYQTTKWGL